MRDPVLVVLEAPRQAGAREGLKEDRAVGGQPGRPAAPQRRAGRQRQQQREMGAQAVQQPDRALGVRHADVHVQGERRLAARDPAHRAVHDLVARRPARPAGPRPSPRDACPPRRSRARSHARRGPAARAAGRARRSPRRRWRGGWWPARAPPACVSAEQCPARSSPSDAPAARRRAEPASRSRDRGASPPPRGRRCTASTAARPPSLSGPTGFKGRCSPAPGWRHMCRSCTAWARAAMRYASPIAVTRSRDRAIAAVAGDDRSRPTGLYASGPWP